MRGSGRAFVAASAALITDQQNVLKRPFAEVADGPTPLRAAAGTAEGQGGPGPETPSPGQLLGCVSWSRAIFGTI